MGGVGEGKKNVLIQIPACRLRGEGVCVRSTKGQGGSRAERGVVLPTLLVLVWLVSRWCCPQGTVGTGLPWKEEKDPRGIR